LYHYFLTNYQNATEAKNGLDNWPMSDFLETITGNQNKMRNKNKTISGA
jgi:hypothetical protein